MVVRDVSTNENLDGWVEASAEGFCIPFNASDEWSEWHGQTEPLSNIDPGPPSTNRLPR
jgi:hypothetical protein